MGFGSSRDSSLVKVVPFPSRRASVSTKPPYRSFPFALAAKYVSSGRGGVVVNQKRTNSASASVVISWSRSKRSNDLVRRSSRRTIAASLCSALSGESNDANAASMILGFGNAPSRRQCVDFVEEGWVDIGCDLGFLHSATSQFDAVVRIEGRLTRDVAEAGLHGAGALGLVVGFVFESREFLARERQFGRHILMFWDFRLSPDATIPYRQRAFSRTSFLGRCDYRLKTAPIIGFHAGLTKADASTTGGLWILAVSCASRKYRTFCARIGAAPDTRMISSSDGSCMISPGVSKARAVSWRETIRCPSQGDRRWPA